MELVKIIAKELLSVNEAVCLSYVTISQKLYFYINAFGFCIYEESLDYWSKKCIIFVQN